MPPTRDQSIIQSTTFAIVALCLANTVLAAGNSDPRSDLLLDPTELAKSPDTYLVLDARPQEDYEQSHIPDAVWVDHETWKDAFGMGDDATAWSKRIGNLGIGPESQVVVYDDHSSKNAARICKSADELSELFALAGVDPQRPTATHCQSGGRASVMAFGLELMGMRNVSIYYAGWNDWGNAKETPVIEKKQKSPGLSPK
ncbi:sulfurtransferase [Novipirellula artificiosorum]|nr:rhodanese-like domain-containing protein [Novipirellula artificiosorum]